MSKVQILRELVSQRLTVAVEEILGLCERTMREYEEEFCRSQQENVRLHKLLFSAFNPEVRLNRSDIQQVQQEWSPNLDQEEPEPEHSHFKEEHKELWTSQEGEHLQDPEEADVTKFPFTLVPVRNEEDEDKVHSSQLHQSQTEENRKAEPLASSSTEQTETGVHVEDHGGPEPSRNIDPDSYLQPATEVEASASSEPQAKDSKDDEKETEEPQSSLTTLKINNVSDASDVQCNCHDTFFFCSECGAPYKYLSDLKTHMRSHGAEGAFSCSVCEKRFKLAGDLKTHMTIHTREKLCKCSFCGQCVRLPGALMTIHTGEKPFSCPFCSQNFSVPDALTSHMKTHPAGRLRQTELIARSSTEQTKTKADVEDCGGPEPSKNLNPGSSTQPESDDKASDSFEPKTEDSEGDWTETRELRSSLNTLKNNEVPLTQRNNENGNLKECTRVHTGQIRCPTSGNSFSNKAHLKHHQGTHVGEALFTCFVCGKKFVRGEFLKTHMRSHTGEKPFSCSFCAQTFTQSAHLKTHMKGHTAQTFFTCSFCGKQFLQNEQLMSHMKIHLA